MTSRSKKSSEKIGYAKRNGAKTAARARGLVSRITKRYLLLVALFAALSLADYTFARKYLNMTVQDAAVLNISGRQRMLSQRAALLAEQLTNIRDQHARKLVRDELLAITRTMERAHLGLVRGDPNLNLPGQLSAELRAHYFDVPTRLDARVRAYIGKIRTLTNAPHTQRGPQVARIMASALTLLPYLDKAVQLYQVDIEGEVARQTVYRTAWMLGVMGVLLIFALGVFRPLARRIELAINDSEEAATALSNSETKYRELIEGSIQGIVIMRNFHPLFANQSAANILGYPSPAAILRIDSWMDIVAPRERSRIKKYSQLRHHGASAPVHYEHRALRRDGTEMWLDTQVRVIDWEGARAAQVSLIDVTERKKARNNLQAAVKKAKIANRAKSEFLANISHELRTPLNAILGFSELMQQKIYGELNDKYQSYANDIHESGQHLLSLINDIIDLSKIEAGKRSLQEDIVDLSRTISACLRIVRVRAQEGGLTITEQIAPDLPFLQADERALKQILLNLLSNAIKFTPANGAVTIEAAQNTDGSIRISVADTGIGLNKEQIATAWSAFGQIESAMSSKYEGAGLGLPIVRSLIDLHGGAIELDSEPGVGTKVTMRFPPVRTVSNLSTVING